MSRWPDSALLAEESGHRLAGLVAREQLGRQRCDLVTPFVDAGDQVAVEDLLALAATVRVRLAEVREDLRDLSGELRVGHRPGDEADLGRLGRVELPSRQEQVGRGAVTEPRDETEGDDRRRQPEA